MGGGRLYQSPWESSLGGLYQKKGKFCQFFITCFVEFSSSYFLRERLLFLCNFTILSSKSGEMLPVFLEEILLLCDFSIWQFQLGGNAAHFSGRNLFLCDFSIWGLKLGENAAALFFWESSCVTLPCLEQGGFLVIYLVKFLFPFDFSICGQTNMCLSIFGFFVWLAFRCTIVPLGGIDIYAL